MKIGYIGLGNMGGPMAANLVKSGCDVAVYDLEQSKIDQLAAPGATAATSGDEVAAQVDVLFTSLPEPRHVAASVPALIEVMRAGSVWVDLTTNDRDLLLQLAKKASLRNVAVVEAPADGGGQCVEAPGGYLSAMVSSAKAMGVALQGAFRSRATAGWARNVARSSSEPACPAM